MYYYQWPNPYYYSRSCSYGCAHPSQCQFKQQHYHQQFFPTHIEQQYMEQNYSEEQYSNEIDQTHKNNEEEQEIFLHKTVKFPIQNEAAHKFLEKLDNIQKKMEEIEKENGRNRKRK